jgi:hypothetical protein
MQRTIGDRLLTSFTFAFIKRHWDDTGGDRATANVNVYLLSLDSMLDRDISQADVLLQIRRGAA